MRFSIAPFRDSIIELCRKYGVQRLDLFGSGAGESFNESSDLDFLVDFIDREPAGAADRYFGLRTDLQQTLQRPVDLVVRSAVRNPYFLKSAQQGTLNVYAA